MKNSVIKDIIATVAPTLATALGGPLAGVATRAIAAKILGKDDASFAEVEAAITGASGADLVRLKELEYEFKAQMEEADIKLESIAADDRNSARQRQVQMKDWTPSVLGLAIIIGFFGVLAYIFRFGLPAEGSEVLLIMMGALGTMTSQVGNFFFGSSSGSKSKDAVIADLKGAQG
ncbi:hypothetical protein [Halocynthiibacter namhaensis]|uniref:hypothetical protein n=1 Tax=Halocynthiibacter namhaensis TaxID=1290553 RepID=UPI00057990E1|nr:hypothetical protein [Halocynthiibacter namhaensis]